MILSFSFRWRFDALEGLCTAVALSMASLVLWLCVCFKSSPFQGKCFHWSMKIQVKFGVPLKNW